MLQGKMTPDSFIEYYANLSWLIDADEVFELMVCNDWKLSKQDAIRRMNHFTLILVTHLNGEKTVEPINSDICNDESAITSTLEAKGVEVKSVQLLGRHDTASNSTEKQSIPAHQVCVELFF